MPGPGKSFEAFLADQATCKDYAAFQVKGQAEQANQRAVGAAVLTTLLAAALGGAVGSGWGAAGQGAGVGAVAGVATGTTVGANMNTIDQFGIQMQYDAAYSQCMYAKGDVLPGYPPPEAVPLAAATSPLAGPGNVPARPTSP
jgi:outer membrane lipoprotein SlyB